MSKSSKEPARPWRAIADELSHANRSDRIVELAEELEQAFREQMPSPRKPPQVAVLESRIDKQISPQPQRKQN